MALWTPQDEPGLISWFDMSDPDSYDTGAKTWDARWGSLQCVVTSGAGPTKISTGFSGNKDALTFSWASDTDMKILNPGFTEIIYVTVINVTTAGAAAPILWTRDTGLGVSGLNLLEDFGIQARYLGVSDRFAVDYGQTWPGSAIIISLHSKAERAIRINGEEIATETGVTSGTEPGGTNEFLICPYPGSSQSFAAQVAAIGIFSAASWSDELSEKIEGFIAHNSIGLTTDVLPALHPYKSSAPGADGENIEFIQTIEDFTQDLVIGAVVEATVSQTIADFTQDITWDTVNDVAVSQTIADFSQLTTLGFSSTAIKLLDSNGWSGVTIDPATVTSDDNTDQYLEGGDFDDALWSTNSIYKWWILFITGNNNGSPITATYGGPSFETVTGHEDESVTALQFQIIEKPPSTGVPQIRLTDYQTSGTSGNEPVFYQRMWIKFDEDILARAQRVGSTDFYHIFWEPKCEPDYRMRVQLQYNGTKLYWVAHDDVLTNANHIHTGTNSTVDVVLAPKNSPLGWHKFEVWVDRPNGVWRAAVDGSDIINLDFGPGDDLYGVSGNIMNFPMFVQLYSTVSLPFDGDGPMYMLVEDLEIYDQPPEDAWEENTLPEIDAAVSQTIADFSQEATLELGIVSIASVSQTIDDFEQAVEVIPVVPEGAFNVNQFLADFSARLTVQLSIDPPATPEYPTVGCGPGSYGAPVASANQLLRREIHRPWPTR